jgi:hypothetical protein
LSDSQECLSLQTMPTMTQEVKSLPDFFTHVSRAARAGPEISLPHCWDESRLLTRLVQ